MKTKKFKIKNYKLSELMKLCKKYDLCVGCPLNNDINGNPAKANVPNACDCMFGPTPPASWQVTFEKEYLIYDLSRTPNKLRVGDEVKLKKDLVKGKKYGGITLLPPMMYKGYNKIQAIKYGAIASLVDMYVVDECGLLLELCFSLEMLDLTCVKRGRK